MDDSVARLGPRWLSVPFYLQLVIAERERVAVNPLRGVLLWPTCLVWTAWAGDGPAPTLPHRLREFRG